MALLEVQRLTVRYSGLVAVDDVSISVDTGKIAGLVGPNGAGKTTLIDAVTGFIRSEGRVLYDGREISRLPAFRRARSGIARTFQSLELFEDLTVRENVLVAADLYQRGALAVDVVRGGKAARVPAVEDALAMFGLDDVAEAPPTELSHGRRRLLGLARAVAAQPRVLICDEPAAGLHAGESAQLGQTLRAIRDRGIAILLVEHDMSLVLGVCDHVTVLDFGRCIFAGSPEEMRVHPAVVRAYLGEDVPHAALDASRGGT